MSHSHETESRIQDLADGILDEKEQRELLVRIAENPELIRLYVSQVGLDLSLQELTQYAATKPIKFSRARSRRRQAFKLVLASAAVVALSCITFQSLKPSPAGSLRSSQGTLYQLETTGWMNLGRERQSFYPGDAITLRQGVLELGFGSGVRGVVEGPARLVFQEVDRVAMADGRAYFEVPDGAEGFKVVTRDLVATDLGTEFAVETGEAAPDEVHVIRGGVEVAPQGHAERKKVLEAGQAVKSLADGDTAPTPFQGSVFRKQLPKHLPYLHLPGELREDGSLLVHGETRGDEPVQAQFVAGELGKDAQPSVEGRFGSALKLSGRGDHVLTDWAGIGQDDPRTVAFWVRMEPGEVTYDTACVVWGYRPQGIETVNRKWNVQVSLDRETKSRCIVNTTFGGFWFEGTTSLDDGQWHHVAAVYTGQNLPDGMPDLRLFIDGKRESGKWVWNEPIDHKDGDVRVRTETRAEEGAEPLQIGKPLHDRNSFRGELDEIYVIAGALDAEAVQTLWKRNRLEFAKPGKDE